MTINYYGKIPSAWKTAITSRKFQSHTTRWIWATWANADGCWGLFGLSHTEKLKPQQWSELGNALSVSCWAISPKSGPSVHRVEQTNLHSPALPGSAFPRRRVSVKHSKTPWQEAATGLLPCSAHLWGLTCAKAQHFHLRPACGFFFFFFNFLPSTWKKWLIPARVFAHKGTQMVQFRTVSHSGEYSV